MYNYEVISKSELSEWKNKFEKFYIKHYKDDYVEAFENTTFFSFCTNDNKIVGAARAISDLKRFALIVDLKVDDEHQKQGIATTIIKNLIDQLNILKIDHINLVVANEPDWLKNFYIKLGFTEIIDSELMEHTK